jgi:hypothetical protein
MKAALICNPPLEWARLRMKAIRRRGFADSAIRLLDTALDIMKRHPSQASKLIESSRRLLEEE